MTERILSAWKASLLVALTAVAGAGGAVAAPLSLFRTQDTAQQNCPNDTVVWLDLAKRTYYSPGQRLYARGSKGVYVCRKAARDNGYRRSLLGRR